ncbi:MAG TPA: hypothetical protein VNA89_02475 [Gemmatimonadaceae bacterium]|nr:hypothetical protein [Gemmatimonadaceae bacterium]
MGYHRDLRDAAWRLSSAQQREMLQETGGQPHRVQHRILQLPAEGMLKHFRPISGILGHHWPPPIRTHGVLPQTWASTDDLPGWPKSARSVNGVPVRPSDASAVNPGVIMSLISLRFGRPPRRSVQQARL